MSETVRIPTWFALFWVEPTADPTSQTGWTPISGPLPPLQAALATPLPSGVRMLSDPRGAVFQTTADFAPPAGPAGPITLNVSSQDGRYHPRVVNVTPPAALMSASVSPIYAPLWPSLKAAAINEAGALVTHLQWSAATGASQLPASWAVLTLACSRNGLAYGFVAQADVNGDVIVPLSGLPPPPATSTTPAPDVMTLTVRADKTVSGANAGADTDAVIKLAPATVTNASAATVPTLSLTWGKINSAAATGGASLTLTAA